MLLGVVALWGWTFVVVKDAVAIYGVLPFLAVRFAIGAACVGAVCFRRADRRTFGAGAAIGLVLGTAFLLQTLGLERASASITGLITGLFVLFAPLANRLLFGVRTPRSLWAAIGASLLGLALLTGAAPGGWGAGEVLATGGAALFGLHVALLDRWAGGRNATVLAFGQLSGAAALFAVLWAVTGKPAAPPPGVWPALLITGVGASAVAYLVQTHAQQRLTAVQTSLILLVETLFAVLFGCWLHGDRMTPLQIAGGAIMVAMMALAELRRPPGGGKDVQHDPDASRSGTGASMSGGRRRRSPGADGVSTEPGV